LAVGGQDKDYSGSYQRTPYWGWIKSKCQATIVKNKEKIMKDKFTKISNEEYASHFGLINPKRKKIHKKAFKKAWNTRNFEIDKFWQRSMFFWGFIALIFTGYFNVVTGKFYNITKGMYLDFYLILLGLIFSVAWLLIIKGSKRWQENWEEHINYLEDQFTGPLYKTIFYKGKYYYSVSGINKILAWVVIVTWCFLLIQYLFCNCNVFKYIFDYICNNLKVFILLCIPFIGTVFCIIFMIIKGQSFGGVLNGKIKKGESGAFFVKEKIN